MKEDPAFLGAVSKSYTRGSLQDKAIRELVVRTFEPFIEGGWRGLQLGYSEGVDTGLLCRRLEQLDIVEGCEAFIAEGEAAGLPNVRFHAGLFEDFELEEGAAPYDCVFAVYVLEHVIEVAQVLAMCRKVLRPGGKLFVVVPNARALSRQLAVHMGLLEGLHTLTPNDKNHGHRRVYNRVSLNRDLEASGWRIISQGGVMLKILADFQLDRLMREAVLTQEHVEGLYRLGLEYPDLCGSLYAVCDARETL